MATRDVKRCFGSSPLDLTHRRNLLIAVSFLSWSNGLGVFHRRLGSGRSFSRNICDVGYCLRPRRQRGSSSILRQRRELFSAAMSVDPDPKTGLRRLRRVLLRSRELSSNINVGLYTPSTRRNAERLFFWTIKKENCAEMGDGRVEHDASIKERFGKPATQPALRMVDFSRSFFEITNGGKQTNEFISP